MTPVSEDLRVRDQSATGASDRIANLPRPVLSASWFRAASAALVAMFPLPSVPVCRLRRRRLMLSSIIVEGIS